MLVLSRKDGEEVVVPQFGIVFRIVEVRGNLVKLGITAPADVQLFRREVWERIHQCNQGKPEFVGPVEASHAVARGDWESIR